MWYQCEMVRLCALLFLSFRLRRFVAILLDIHLVHYDNLNRCDGCACDINEGIYYLWTVKNDVDIVLYIGPALQIMKKKVKINYNCGETFSTQICYATIERIQNILICSLSRRNDTICLALHTGEHYTELYLLLKPFIHGNESHPLPKPHTSMFLFTK